MIGVRHQLYRKNIKNFKIEIQIDKKGTFLKITGIPFLSMKKFSPIYNNIDF